MNNVSGEGRDGGVKRKEKRDRIERKKKEEERRKKKRKRGTVRGVKRRRGLPGTSGFVGEWRILIGIVKTNRRVTRRSRRGE